MGVIGKGRKGSYTLIASPPDGCKYSERRIVRVSINVQDRCDPLITFCLSVTDKVHFIPLSSPLHSDFMNKKTCRFESVTVSV
jgi:hypothetical protein